MNIIRSRLDRINNTDYIKEVVVSDTLPQKHNQENVIN